MRETVTSCRLSRSLHGGDINHGRARRSVQQRSAPRIRSPRSTVIGVTAVPRPCDAPVRANERHNVAGWKILTLLEERWRVRLDSSSSAMAPGSREQDADRRRHRLARGLQSPLQFLESAKMANRTCVARRQGHGPGLCSRRPDVSRVSRHATPGTSTGPGADRE
jgi:hypothetical protein